MKLIRNTFLSVAATFLAAGALMAADSPKDAVTAAAKKLADQANYAWRTTVETSSNARYRPGPTEGKTEKGGFTWISTTRGENTIEAVMKGGKSAVKLQDGWQTPEEASGGDGQQNRGRMISRMVQNFKAPAAEAEDLASKVKELKGEKGEYSGDLTEDGAKALISFGRGRAGGEAPSVSGAKGSVKIWVKDGLITKYEYKVQGSMSFNGNDVEVDRTTTVSVKDVGSTKVEVSEEAKKKL